MTLLLRFQELLFVIWSGCLSRTLDDKRNNTGRLLIAKSRLGPDGIVLPMFMDLASIDIKIYEPKVKTQDDEDLSAAEKLKLLKEKYRHFSGEKNK